MTAPSVHLLVNPTAGGGAAARRVDGVARTLRDHGFDVSVTVTRDAEHASRTAARAEPDVILAPLGGDGMITRTAQGMLMRADAERATLLPLPAGRGNDFVRSLGLPLDTQRVARSLPDALRNRAATTRRIDVARADDAAFLGVLSVGFDAEATARANAMTRLRGPAVYTAAGVAQIASAKRRRYRLMIDGKESVQSLWNIAVGNSGRFGGGLPICPQARLDDGLLDVVTFAGSRAEFMAAALAYRTGRHTRLPHVTQQRCREIHIDLLSDAGLTSAPTGAYADGEPLGPPPTHIRVEPAALRVLVPSLPAPA